MSKKFYLIIIVILLILNVFSWRMWWMDSFFVSDINKDEIVDKGKRDRGGRGMHFFAEKLNLDDKQMQGFEESRLVYFSDIKVIDEKLKGLRKGLLDLMVHKEAEMNKDSIFEIMGQLKMKFEERTFNHLMEMRSLCNDEQKIVFDKLFLQMLNRPPKFHDNRPKRKKGRRNGSKRFSSPDREIVH